MRAQRSFSSRDSRVRSSTAPVLSLVPNQTCTFAPDSGTLKAVMSSSGPHPTPWAETRRTPTEQGTDVVPSGTGAVDREFLPGFRCGT
jgi:hypothetical protein